MKSLADWLAHLESLHPKGQGGIELGLERVSRVKDELRQTQNCPLIIVGGTNGKGSTCAYLEAIYTHAGYRVGCYTSPHLLEYNERVRVDRAPIDDASLCQAFAKVEAARQSAGELALTYFEFGTLAAWEVFVASQVEVIILEVGLGGRLDAVKPMTPIAPSSPALHSITLIGWVLRARRLVSRRPASIAPASRRFVPIANRRSPCSITRPRLGPTCS